MIGRIFETLTISLVCSAVAGVVAVTLVKRDLEAQISARPSIAVITMDDKAFFASGMTADEVLEMQQEYVDRFVAAGYVVLPGRRVLGAPAHVVAEIDFNVQSPE